MISGNANGDQPRRRRAAVASREYLSDAPARIALAQQGWGELGIDAAAHLPDRAGLPLQIKDQHFAKGLGSHAPGQIVVELDGDYDAFAADIGVQWQGGAPPAGGNVGSVVFQVYVDGEKRFDSGVVREADAPRAVNVPLAGAQELMLVVTDAGDGITCDVADWANARLVRAPAARRRPAPEPLDIAPFARVMTWDPERMDGCRSSRIEEFRAQDVFLGDEVAPGADGSYVVPVAESGDGCIGLEWFERRSLKEIGIEFARTSSAPDPTTARAQRWVGESPWQGEWQPVNGAIEAQGNAWHLRLDWRNTPQVAAGTWKIRWLFPKSARPIAIRRLLACSRSAWGVAELRLQLDRPVRGQRGEVEIYNGVILAPASGPGRRGTACRAPTSGEAAPATPLSRTWDLNAPLTLKLRYAKLSFRKSDRTVLRIKLPMGAFAAAVDDVLAKPVYVRDFGVFITRADSVITPAEYRRAIVRRKTVLERVRRMPDQTFSRAMAKVHHAVQDNGPMMLSLACDNHKFVVERDGRVRYEAFVMAPQFASGKNERLTRHLDGGWLPILVTTVGAQPALSEAEGSSGRSGSPRDAAPTGGVVYLQTTFVAPCGAQTTGSDDSRSLCVAEIEIENPQASAAAASLRLTFFADADKQERAAVTAADSQVLVHAQDKLLAIVDVSESGVLRPTLEPGTLLLAGTLSPGARARCRVYIPAWEMKSEDRASLPGVRDARAAVAAYWNRIMAPAMQVNVPDELLANVIRASQVHCLIAARNEDGGQRVAPWIASMSYGPLESEANSVILGMDLMGHHDFARRSLDFFVKRYNPAGFLTTGYTLVGTGWHLWTLAEHYRLTHDADWLRAAAPEVTRVCQWVARQREKTKRLDPRGEKMPEYGLVPPGVVADWNVFAYRFFLEGHYCAGLRDAAQALADIGAPPATALLESAAEFREDILRAYHYTQARCPVVPLRDGAWAPASPGMLYCFGPIADFYPGEDGARSWAGDVEIGSQHLAALGIMDSTGDERERCAACGRCAACDWMTEYLEDHWFLQSGMGDYPAAENEKDWFNRGGFAKVQPYYGRITDVYAARDEVKPFIRSYFNAIPSLLNTENLSFWEHFHNLGAWNKTHETGWFLEQTRTMLVTERGDELWLAPFVTSNWLKDGMVVEVRHAPTRFGSVGYRITSRAARNLIEAVIDPPGGAPPATRRAPTAIVIRLRHPDGKPMKSVAVNGRPHKDFDPKKETVRVASRVGPITVRARY